MASSVSEKAADLCILGSGIAGMLLAERAVARGRARPDRDRARHGDDAQPASPPGLARRSAPVQPESRAPAARAAAAGAAHAGDRDYPYWPVYNLGGCTNSFFGNMPRWHPSHFDQDAFAGGVRGGGRCAMRSWSLYYLQAEQRLAIAGNSEKGPFPGRFAYPLPPHRLSPSDRACASIFGGETVLQIPTSRLSRTTGGLPQCCGTNKCEACPTDSKGTALNTLYPSIRSRVELRTGLLATTIHARGGRAEAVSAVDASGVTHRIEAREFVVACNGVDSALLLQRSPDLPHMLPSLGRTTWTTRSSSRHVRLGRGRAARYGDSAQTGMFLPFFECTSAELPLSMLGEIRCGSLSEPAGSLMRDVRRGHPRARARRAGRPGRVQGQVRADRRSTLDLWFTVEPQPLASQTVSIDRIEPSGQAIPKIQLRYPTYFTTCLDLLLEYVRRHLPRAKVAHIGTMATGYHRTGATRMSESPADGCLDATLRYHELENLYVLSSSAFPSASSANPTMTLPRWRFGWPITWAAVATPELRRRVAARPLVMVL